MGTVTMKTIIVLSFIVAVITSSYFIEDWIKGDGSVVGQYLGRQKRSVENNNFRIKEKKKETKEKKKKRLKTNKNKKRRFKKKNKNPKKGGQRKKKRTNRMKKRKQGKTLRIRKSRKIIQRTK